MRRMKARLLMVAALTTVGLIAAPLQPAHADSTGTITAVGKCHLDQHIVGPPPIPPKKKGMHIPFTCEFGDKAVAKAPSTTKPTVYMKTQRDLPTKKASAANKDKDIVCVRPGGPCNGGLRVTGVVGPNDFFGPWCGASSGTITGGDFNPNMGTITGVFVEQGTIGIISGTITHGLQSGPFTGVISIDVDTDPNKPANSCLTKPPGARIFKWSLAVWFAKMGPSKGIGMSNK